MGKRESLLLFLIVFLMFCDCKCSVTLPHGAVDWSAVSDCRTFDQTYLLFINIVIFFPKQITEHVCYEKFQRYFACRGTL